MDAKNVKAYFDSEGVVAYYAQAAAELGLWASEEKIFTRLFEPEDSLLELGCGAGRIAIGLYELGYHNLLATDYSKSMVNRARDLAKRLEYTIHCRVCDATALEFEDDVFDGAIFGFNGLMQIPQLEQRARALSEVYRVLRPGAWFAFTTHDRERSEHRDFWQAETLRWEYGTEKPEMDDFGDRTESTDHGMHFMHVPTVAEIKALLAKVGFHIEVSVMRSELGKETAEVEVFSDDCRFWVVQKPLTKSSRLH
jgi:ubiquinone/menaquinone biosynthesis C-methylase UbiE